MNLSGTEHYLERITESVDNGMNLKHLVNCNPIPIPRIFSQKVLALAIYQNIPLLYASDEIYHLFIQLPLALTNKVIFNNSINCIFCSPRSFTTARFFDIISTQTQMEKESNYG